MKTLKDDLTWALKLYSLTLVIPAIMIAILLFAGILGLSDHFTYGFFGTLEKITIGYFFTGHLAGILAIKWHLVLYLIAFIITKFEKY